jgi:lipopolysaccharide biosynthesis protein
MKRTIIFAHYDKDNIIDPYVLQYLQVLRPLANELIFVSDSDLPKSEISKLDVDKKVIGRHGEYDFGSYKRGFEVMSDADQLVFCNDSCYLIDDIEPLLENNSDFFGVITNTNDYPQHLQSYFVVFNRKVVESAVFKKFMSSITKLEKKQEIIERYEIGLTQTLSKAGFSFGSFIREIFEHNPTMNKDYFLKLRPSGFPFLKTDLLKNNPCKTIKVCRWKNGLSAQQIRIINDHVSRMIGDHRNHWYFTSFQAFLKRKTLLNCFFSYKTKKNVLRVRILGIPVLRKNLSNNYNKNH